MSVLERASDATFINRVLNDPLVRADIADLSEGVVNIADKVRDEGNVCLVGEHGGFVFLRYDAGIYEVHSAVLPSGRGAWALAAAKKAVSFMFTATDAIEILTRVPQGHVAADALARAVGFRHQFETPPECLFRGERVPCSILTLTLQEWSVRAEGFEERGAELHALMGRVIGKPHSDDRDHNRIVGIALEMVDHGQIAKGVVWYNRWSVAARHQMINVLSVSPVQIGFDAGILTFANGEIRLEARH